MPGGREGLGLPREDPGIGGRWQGALQRGWGRCLLTRMTDFGMIAWQGRSGVYQLKGSPPSSPGVSVLTQGHESL